MRSLLRNLQSQLDFQLDNNVARISVGLRLGCQLCKDLAIKEAGMTARLDAVNEELVYFSSAEKMTKMTIGCMES